jgi:uncharacterized protein YukE
MATKQDWVFLRDVLRSLDGRVVASEVVQGPSGWELPSDLSGDMARDYLEATRRRFAEVEDAVKKAWLSPIVRVQNAGHDIGARLREGAKRAAKLAEEVASDAAQAFKDTVAEMAEGGKSIATGLGFGAAVVVIVGLLLLRELKG